MLVCIELRYCVYDCVSLLIDLCIAIEYICVLSFAYWLRIMRIDCVNHLSCVSVRIPFAQICILVRIELRYCVNLHISAYWFVYCNCILCKIHCTANYCVNDEFLRKHKTMANRLRLHVRLWGVDQRRYWLVPTWGTVWYNIMHVHFKQLCAPMLRTSGYVARLRLKLVPAPRGRKWHVTLNIHL